ncbi:MAG: hypothetical protein R3C03_15220 [Pirellulaceae bacterium]
MLEKQESAELPTPLLAKGFEAGSTEGSSASLFERVLSPRSIQRMMWSGATLGVLGVVVWLWSIGIFENALLVAVLLGSANVALIAAGVVVARNSRHVFSGKALAFLGSLLLPLNLWFYNSQGLIEINDGGHLWLPAVVCCLIYAIVARTVRDSRFVYTIAMGVVLTGLLFMADLSIGRLFHVLPTATFLAVTGALFVCVDRLFPKVGGDFRQDNFGKAFFVSGNVILAGGAALLAGAQTCGFFLPRYSQTTDGLFVPILTLNSPQVLGKQFDCGHDRSNGLVTCRSSGQSIVCRYGDVGLGLVLYHIAERFRYRHHVHAVVECTCNRLSHLERV